jgi:LacI family transcriptional regulator
VAQPKQRIGTTAAELLIDRLTTGRSEERRVILAPELKVRASSAPYLPRRD